MSLRNPQNQKMFLLSSLRMQFKGGKKSQIKSLDIAGRVEESCGKA